MRPTQALSLALALVVSTQTAVARPIKERVRSASEVIVNRQTSIQPIPKWVVDRSKCVGALRVVKAGFWWGGQGSTGLVSCRTESNKWSAPSFFTVDGVNFGFQIGVQFLESVLLFVTDFARDALNHASFQLGADLSFAAGPVGGGGGAGEMPNAHVLSYQRAVGLYAGATVNGFVLAHNPSFNQQAYETHIEGADLMKFDGDLAPDVVQPYVETLDKYFPTH